MGFALIIAGCAAKSPTIDNHPLFSKIMKKVFVGEIALAIIFGILALYSLSQGRPLSHKSSCIILGFVLFSLGLFSIGGSAKIYLSPDSPPAPQQPQANQQRYTLPMGTPSNTRDPAANAKKSSIHTIHSH